MSSEAVAYGDPETRGRILQATLELLEDSASSVTMSRAAERAGVSRQAVYLHFGDRSGLLVALVDFIDESLGRDRLRAQVFGAANGAESLRQWVRVMSWYTAKIDRVTRVLESGQDHDPALRAAWRDRMDIRRRSHIERIVDAIAAERRLARGWTVAAAADLIYVVTMPAPWRELTQELGWSQRHYADRVWKLLERALLNDAS